MTDFQQRFLQLLDDDPRYKPEAYQFVRDALNFAQGELHMGGTPGTPESHLTGQQLCEAIRQYALQQFGYMAKVVLKSWGIETTSDFGNIVYNLIDIGMMKKSESDRREDFDEVYDFEQALQRDFRIQMPDTNPS